MRKQLLIIPAALLILVGVVAVSRMGGRPPEAPRAELSKEIPKRAPVERKRQVVRGPVARTLRPPPPASPPAAKGRILHDNAVRGQVAVYVKASLRGDHHTASALWESLSKKPEVSRRVARERVAFSAGPREREILNQLIGELK